MVQLDPVECRILGVLVEKAFTSSNYPLSLNALTDGCNQKSNRNPLTSYDEDRVLQGLDSLRDKRLVVFADMLGSRVTKFRHNTREVLGIGEHELVVLVELMLRGPQTAAELRSRASRMQPLESLDAVRTALLRLMDGDEPLVGRVPGGRAERFVQLLCPSLHSLDEPAEAAQDAAGGEAQPDGLAARVARLELEVRNLQRVVRRLAGALGETELLAWLPAGETPESGAAGPSGGVEASGE